MTIVPLPSAPGKTGKGDGWETTSNTQWLNANNPTTAASQRPTLADTDKQRSRIAKSDARTLSGDSDHSTVWHFHG